MHPTQERDLQSQVERLRAELEETQSVRQREQTDKEALEKEIEELRKDLNESTQEKEENPTHSKPQQSDNFDVHKFLSGALEQLPPMPKPIVVTGREGKPRFKGVVRRNINKKSILSANGSNTIKWANQGGGCVIPFPLVIYNGSKNAVEKSRKSIESCSYEFFGVDEHCTYYGTYRCIKLAAVDWTELTSFGREFTEAFLDTAIVQDGHASPAIQSLMRSMYETGMLKAGCAVLRCEGFDETTAGEVEGPKIRGTLAFNTGGKRRPNADDHNGEGSQGPSKKPKLGNNKGKNKASHRFKSAAHETGK